MRRILRILASRLPAEASAQFGDPPEMPAWTLEPARVLDQLVELFDLSPFERDVLLLCAARRECGKLEKSLTNCNLYEE